MNRSILLGILMLFSADLAIAQVALEKIDEGHTQTISSMAFNSDGSRLASLDYSGKLLVWDVGSGKVVKDLSITDDKIQKLTPSTDGSMFALVTRSNLMIFDFKTLNAVKIIPFKVFEASCGEVENIHAVAFNYDNNRIAVATYKYKKPKYAVVYNLDKSQIEGKACKLKDEAKALGLNRDGSIVGVGTFEYGKVRFYNTVTGNEVKAFKISDGNCGCLIHFTPDGNYIIVGSSNEAYFVNASTYERLNTIPACELAYAATGNTFVDYSAWNLYQVETRPLFVYRIPDTTPIVKFDITLSDIPLQTEFRPFPRCMTISPDSRLVAIGRSDGLIKVISINSQSTLADLGSIKTPGQVINAIEQKEFANQTVIKGNESSKIKLTKVERSSPPSITNFFIPVPKNATYGSERDIILVNSIISNYLQALTDINYFDPFLLLQTNGINQNPKEYYRKGIDELKPIYSKLPIDYYIWGGLDRKPSGESTLRFGIWQGNKVVVDTVMQVFIASLYEKVYTALPILLAKIGIPFNQQVHDLVGSYINKKNGTYQDMGESLYYFFEAITLDNPDRLKGLLANSNGCIDKMIKTDARYSWAYSNRGFINNFIRPEKAMDEFQKALKLEPRNFEALTGIAMAAEIQKKPDYMKYWQQVVDFNPSILMYANKYLSNFYYDQKYSEGYPEADRLLNYYKLKENANGIALASAWKAIFGLNISKTDDFEKLYKQALALAPQDYNPDVAKALTDFGIECDYYGLEGKSLPLFELAYNIDKKFYPVPSREMYKTLRQYCMVLLNSGSLAQVEPLLGEFKNLTLALFGERSEQMTDVRNFQSSFYQHKGEYQKANQIARESVTSYDRTPDANPINHATAVRLLADTWYHLGSYGLAIETYEKAIGMFKKVQNFADVAYTLNSMGLVYYRLKNLTKAEATFNECLSVIKNHPERNAGTLLSVYNNLGQIAREKGDLKKAGDLLNSSITEREKLFGVNHPNLVPPINNLALLYLEQKRLTDAEGLLLRALRICEANPSETTSALPEILNSMGLVKEEAGDYPGAHKYYQQSISQRESILGPGHPSLGAVYANNARINLYLNQVAESEQWQVKAIDAYMKQFYSISAASSEEHKLLIADETRKALDVYFVYPTRLMPENAKVRTRAFELWSKRKGIVLEMLRQTTTSLGEQATGEARTVFLRLNEVKDRLARLYLNGLSGRSADEYKNLIATTEQERDELESKLSTLSAAFASTQNEKKASFPQIVQKIPTGSALIDFARIKFNIIDKNKPDEVATIYYAFVLKGGATSPELVELGNAAAIEAAIANLKNSVSQPHDYASFAEKSKELHNLVFSPLNKYLVGSKSLYISTDGLLSVIPLEILVDNTDRFLAEKYTISYLTTSRDLLKAKTSAQGGKSVVIGNPDFDWKDPSLTTSLVGTSSYLDGLSFTPLPGTAAEIDAVSSTIGLNSVTFLSNREATKYKFLETKSPRILHVATHGFFLSDVNITSESPTRGFKSIDNVVAAETNPSIAIRVENPMLRSGLVFAGANGYLASNSQNKSQAVATAMEIMQMNLTGTELVALSACETGLGKTVNGEGVFGLQRAFLAAGASNLLMTMWQIPDKETQELITLFYQFGLKEGKSKADALNLARVRMIETTKQRYGYAYPFYWGAFVLLGK